MCTLVIGHLDLFIRFLQGSLVCLTHAQTHTHTHTHPFNGPFSGTTRVSRYQEGKTNLDFIEARDSEQQWHQLGHMQVCTSLQTDNYASTPPLSFLRAGCTSCRPTDIVKALKAKQTHRHTDKSLWHTQVTNTDSFSFIYCCAVHHVLTVSR